MHFVYQLLLRMMSSSTKHIKLELHWSKPLFRKSPMAPLPVMRIMLGFGITAFTDFIVLLKVALKRVTITTSKVFYPFFRISIASLFLSVINFSFV